ncbi:hypothetical protein [Agaribacterium sp. ZY112]|uniref:hypothetical protein n=1 Tax=Agaribacterium sp. ZY112 TaxID=3233574 RepID=UPI00352677DC
MYKISFNHSNFLNLSLDMKKLMFTIGRALGGVKEFQSYPWDNKSLVKCWVDIGASFIKVEGLEQTKAPDITTWNRSHLVLSPVAYKAIGLDLEPYGEFLTITIDGEAYKVFNCLNVVEVDSSQSKSDIVNEQWMGIKSIGFPKDTIDNNLIFKTKFDRCGSLYCGEALKEMVERHKLKGVNFLDNLTEDF